MTSLTVEEFTALVDSFEAAFLDDMGDWTLPGQRRQARRDTTEKNCPLPTLEDRLLFSLVYLKQHPTHLLHGRLFGVRQSKATPWIHVLLPVLRTALRTAGDVSCRTLEALRGQLGVAGPPGRGRLACSRRASRPPPCGHDGTERPIPCPQDAPQQQTCDRGKNKPEIPI